MCGIAGIYLNKKTNKKEREEMKEAVEKMNASQKNRGPDDDGINLITNNLITIAFGHRRLSIIDLSKAGHQPMEYRDLCIAFNGEIYNFIELKKDLEKKGYKFKTKTDTEVILALYAEYGEKSFSILRGMFAFGLWDGNNQKLFLVKDRYGIKPLYYYADNEKLVFASTVKALENSGIIPIQKNPEAYIGFLLFGSVPLPTTTIKNVYAVSVGHYLIREADGSQKLIKYYDPLDYFNLGKSDLPNIDVNLRRSDFQNIEGIIKQTRELLSNSINFHLISDAPLGVFLSGGLDSSVIAALAASQRKNPITTLSIIFDEKEFSEEYYSDLVAKRINSDHRKIKITKQDFYDSFEEIFEAMDQPTINGVNTFFIAKAAKQAGLKTVLSGLGADEIFLGYPHFKKAEFLRKIQNLPKFLKPSLDLASLFGGRYKKLSYLKNSDILSFYLGIRGLFALQEVAKILGIEIKEVENFIEEIENKILNPQSSILNSLHPADLLSYLELKFYLQNQLLKDTDFMSMHHSIEVRVPFLDHPLVEYISDLPPEIKLGGSVNKALLVESVRDFLPPEIFTRPKMGFTFPFQKWLEDKSSVAAKRHWSRSWAKTILEKF